MSNTRNYLGQDINTENLTPSASETQKGLIEIVNTAEALSLTDDTKALTALKLGAILGAGLLAPNGYLSIPMVIGGLKQQVVIQWGYVAHTTQGQTVLYPKPFPSGCTAVIPIDAVTNAAGVHTLGITKRDANFDLYSINSSTGAQEVAGEVYFIAIGY